MKSNVATPICKICFKPIGVRSWSLLMSDKPSICERCYAEFEPRVQRFRVDGVKGIALFPYDQTIKSTLFQFKGCFDYELGEIYLSRAIFVLKAYAAGCYLMPVPSFLTKDEARGFNHVEVIFSKIGLGQIKAIKKTKDVKQSSLKSVDRKNVSSILEWVDNTSIEGKKILLVDDVFTTGSTLKACVKLIKDHHPKSLKILVMAKTEFKG